MFRIFKRYPGNKSRHQIDDGADYDAVIEPCAGSAALSVQMMCRGIEKVFLADSDPTVRAVYEVWADPNLHETFYNSVRWMLDCLREDPAFCWTYITDLFVRADLIPITEAAAVSLLVRDLTFGGVVRTGSDGKFNAPLVEAQRENVLRWGWERHRLPPLPQHLTVCASAFELLHRCRTADFERGLCLIDPPYYSELPAHRQYGGYNPNDAYWIDFCRDLLFEALDNPRIARVVVTNYHSEILDQEIRRIGGDRLVRSVKLGQLNKMQKKHGTQSKNVEVQYEFVRSQKLAVL